MKKCLITIAAFFLLFGANAQETFHPKADKGAEVVFGKARFTVLTPRLIRMEWSENGSFEDRATLGIVNRELPVPAFKTSKSGRKVTINTGALTLTYTGQEEFNAKNLSVSFTMAAPGAKKGVKKVSWKPGDDDSGNLLGTARTLDRFNYETRFKDGKADPDGTSYTVEPFDKGVISRDGWAIIDESGRHVLTDAGSTTLKIAAREGSYKGAEADRLLRVVFHGVAAPSKVSVDGVEYSYSRHAAREAAEGKAVWGYDGVSLSATVYLPESPVSAAHSVVFEGEFSFTSGEKGLLQRMRAITPEAKTVFAAKISSHLQLTPILLAFAGTGSYITEDPWNAAGYISELDVKALEDNLRSLGRIPEEFISKITAQAAR